MICAAMAAALLLAGCGGGDDQAAGQPQVASGAAAAATDDRAGQLKVAAQGYVDALLKGNIGGVVGYLDPEVCDDDDEASYALGIGQIKETAEGATMKILSVKLYDDGARGGADQYELSKGAPDQLRRLIKSSMAESKTGAWNYRDGEWYLAGPCEDESASPVPTS